MAKKKGFQSRNYEKAVTKVKILLFSHSRASRIRKFFLSDNHGGREYFSVFHAPHPLISPHFEIHFAGPDSANKIPVEGFTYSVSELERFWRGRLCRADLCLERFCSNQLTLSVWSEYATQSLICKTCLEIGSQGTFSVYFYFAIIQLLWLYILYVMLSNFYWIHSWKIWTVIIWKNKL